MAKHMDVYYTDDLTGERVTPDAVEHVTFSLDGASYEIDLSPESADKLRSTLAGYVTAGRKVGGKPVATTRKPAVRKASDGDKPDIRGWALAQGMKVADRGRIPLNVQEAYDQAHKAGTAAVVEETDSVVDEAPEGKAWVEEKTEAPTDEQIIAWALSKGLRTPKNGKPSGPLKDKYLADRDRAAGRGNVLSINRGA